MSGATFASSARRTPGMRQKRIATNDFFSIIEPPPFRLRRRAFRSIRLLCQEVKIDHVTNARSVKAVENEFTTTRRLAGLGKAFVHFLFEGDELFHARALLDALIMRRDIRKIRDVDAELLRAAAAPVEMRVRRGEMVEEEFAPGEPVVAELELLVERFRR